MSEAIANPNVSPHQKLDAAVIASRPTRRYRAAAFQAYVLGASVVFIALAIIAHTVAYFPIDLTITHAVQSYHGAAFGQLMYGISWLGFIPQVDVLADPRDRTAGPCRSTVGGGGRAVCRMRGRRWDIG